MPELSCFSSATNNEWMDEAICIARRFERLADGSYVCSEFSSGLWIRCVEKQTILDQPDELEVLAAGGDGRPSLMPLCALLLRATSGS